MKNLILFSIFILTSCATQKIIPDKRVCFLLYDLKSETYKEIVNEKRCHKRFAAASTFKIPLSVMAFDSGVFKSEKSPVFKWNGSHNAVDAWNADHTPQTWMKDSVVWMSQEITPKIGMEKITKYLNDFSYGNQDMTSGLKYAWLTPAPFIHEPMQNSLKISAYEQVNFLKKLWQGELKSSQSSQLLTRNILTREESLKQNTLIGKTGSGFRDEKFEIRLGWYVGYLESKDSNYIVVINFTDTKKQPAGTFGGREAKELAKKLLLEKGL